MITIFIEVDQSNTILIKIETDHEVRSPEQIPTLAILHCKHKQKTIGIRYHQSQFTLIIIHVWVFILLVVTSPLFSLVYVLIV